MNPLELGNALNDGFIDENGLVCPHKGDKNSQNGVMFSSIFNILTESYRTDLDLAISRCFKETGLLMRTPDNTGGQEQFDNYFTLAVASIILGRTNWPRDILRYGVKHFFVFNTDGKLEFQDWLGRFVYIWPMMFVAAFPRTKWLMWPIISLFGLFQKAGKIEEVGSSSLQLQWVYLMGHKKLYGKSLYWRWYRKMEQLNGGYPVRKMISTYYGEAHPYTRAFY